MTEYLPLIKFSAKLGTSLFAGTTLYCSLVEHPAMLECGTKQAADHWNAMFKRAAPFQVSLSATGALSSMLAYYLSKQKNYLYSSLILLSITPYTLLFMMPTNYALMDRTNDRSSERTRELLKKWGRLHAVRSFIGLAAVSFLIYNA